MSTTSTKVSYAKRLEGIRPNKELKELVLECKEFLGSSKDKQYEKASQQQAADTFNKWWTDKDTLNKAKFIPIYIVTAINTLLSSEKQHTKLEDALRHTQLVYTPPPPSKPPNNEQVKFQKRLERLRLQQEEHKYNKLTQNLNIHAPSDDITTRSMTYAASIGLNMIIAPLSFGCFMYFFCGSLLNFFFTDNNNNNSHYTGPDIRRVVVAVVSGVGMMFIEMLLFVIRTHEMDAAMRKKAKKNKPGAFGRYTAHTTKTYQD